MNTQELIKHAQRIHSRVRGAGERLKGVQAEVTDFLFVHAGPKSSFYQQAKDSAGSYLRDDLSAILESFIEYVQSGLHGAISPERKAQIDVVSDFLEQANVLLETKNVHPAAPALLIGATLEEFLRTWVESQGLSIGNKKPSIDAYATTLREGDVITKQDYKDITAWAGIRNHAAHGVWDQVSNRQRIGLMLEGINLFMRKYSERA